MGERLRAVEVAVGGVGDAYYNMNLFDAVAIEFGGFPSAGLGYAAKDMLVPTSGYTVGVEFSGDMLGRWRLSQNLCDACGVSAWREWSTVETAGSAAVPFFARAGGAVGVQMQGDGVRPFAAVSSGRESARVPWRQFGLQWRRRHGAYTSVAEVSRVDESRSVWGTNFGALGDTRTKTLQSRLRFSAKLRRHWQGFVGYDHSSGKVSVTGGMLSGVSGLRAEGWSAGVQGKNLFRDDDILRFSARQETAVRGGQIRIDHLVATGNGFVDAFYRGRPQTLERRRTVIDLRARPTTRYALGYALPIGRSARLALALEYEGESGHRGVSSRLRMQF